MRAPVWQVALACGGLVLGCASPRERLYTLSGAEPPAAITPPTLHVVVGPVTIPEAVDRPQLVVRHNTVQVVALEQERWAEPLREAIPRVLSEVIGSKLPTASVTRFAAAPATRWDVRVLVNVARFEAIPGERVIIETHWWLRLTDDKTVAEGNSVARVTVQGGPRDYDAIVAAEAAGLAEIGAELARVIDRQTVRPANL